MTLIFDFKEHVFDVSLRRLQPQICMYKEAKTKGTANVNYWDNLEDVAKPKRSE